MTTSITSVVVETDITSTLVLEMVLGVIKATRASVTENELQLTKITITNLLHGERKVLKQTKTLF